MLLRTHEMDTTVAARGLKDKVDGNMIMGDAQAMQLLQTFERSLVKRVEKATWHRDLTCTSLHGQMSSITLSPHEWPGIHNLLADFGKHPTLLVRRDGHQVSQSHQAPTSSIWYMYKHIQISNLNCMVDLPDVPLAWDNSMPARLNHHTLQIIRIVNTKVTSAVCRL